jgi:hypothetical protein
MPVDPKLFSRLEAMGEDAVLQSLLQGVPPADGSEHRMAVEGWVKMKEAERASAASARKEAREEESLSISRKALANSERATRIAISAIVLSISMAILSIIKWYSTGQ